MRTPWPRSRVADVGDSRSHDFVTFLYDLEIPNPGFEFQEIESQNQGALNQSILPTSPYPTARAPFLPPSRLVSKWHKRHRWHSQCFSKFTLNLDGNASIQQDQHLIISAELEIMSCRDSEVLRVSSLPTSEALTAFEKPALQYCFLGSVKWEVRSVFVIQQVGWAASLHYR